jgi:phosphate transport system substrate-binding protein
MLRRLVLVLFALSCWSAVSCTSGFDKGKVVLQGAGATFPAPVYAKWFADYQDKHADVKIIYEPVGSGVGIKMFSEGKVDFGASDAAMTDEQIRDVKDGGVLMVPLVAGNIVLAYNLPNFDSELRLSREAYVGIFLGDITYWDDEKIVKAQNESNKGKLRHTPITAVHRRGASGTTFVFTQHLSAVSPTTWKPGTGLKVAWPATGFGAKGTDGVVEKIQETEGAIGYLNFGYAQANKLPIATLENKVGEYIKPSVESGQAALNSVTLPENLRAFVPDPDGKGCYPLVTFTWLLVHKAYPDAKRAAALKDLCKYALTDGQKDCATEGFIPLPEAVVQRALKAVESIGP